MAKLQNQEAITSSLLDYNTLTSTNPSDLSRQRALIIDPLEKQTIDPEKDASTYVPTDYIIKEPLGGTEGLKFDNPQELNPLYTAKDALSAIQANEDRLRNRISTVQALSGNGTIVTAEGLDNPAVSYNPSPTIPAPTASPTPTQGDTKNGSVYGAGRQIIVKNGKTYIDGKPISTGSALPPPNTKYDTSNSQLWIDKPQDPNELVNFQVQTLDGGKRITTNSRLLNSIILKESGGLVNITNKSSGAQGAFQIIPKYHPQYCLLYTSPSPRD